MKRTLTTVALVLSAAAVIFASSGSPPPTVTKLSPIRAIAYGFLLNRGGNWIGPTDYDGEPDFSIIDDLITANPSHLRITTAANSCDANGECFTDVPRDRQVIRQIERLQKAGIQLGAAIMTGGRSDAEIRAQACRIHADDSHALYSWLFLDHFTSHGGGQQLVTDLRNGTGCEDGGWPLVMTNASGYRRDVGLARGTWAAAKRFSLLNGYQPANQAARAADGLIPALTDQDRRFVSDVNTRFSHVYPILKLEVPSQSGDTFARLDPEVQNDLLRRWSEAQYRFGYKMIYPLYIHASRGNTEYDSREAGTYDTQVELIASDY